MQQADETDLIVRVAFAVLLPVYPPFVHVPFAWEAQDCLIGPVGGTKFLGGTNLGGGLVPLWRHGCPYDQPSVFDRCQVWGLGQAHAGWPGVAGAPPPPAGHLLTAAAVIMRPARPAVAQGRVGAGGHGAAAAKPAVARTCAGRMRRSEVSRGCKQNSLGCAVNVQGVQRPNPSDWGVAPARQGAVCGTSALLVRVWPRCSRGYGARTRAVWGGGGGPNVAKDMQPHPMLFHRPGVLRYMACGLCK